MKEIPVRLMIDVTLFYDPQGIDAEGIAEAGEDGVELAREDLATGVRMALQRAYNEGALLGVDECPEGIYVKRDFSVTLAEHA